MMGMPAAKGRGLKSFASEGNWVEGGEQWDDNWWDGKEEEGRCTSGSVSVNFGTEQCVPSASLPGRT